MKDTKPADLIEAVRVVAGGEALLSPTVTRRLIAEFAARAKEPPRSAELEELTEREREVMAPAAEELSNDEIVRTRGRTAAMSSDEASDEFRRGIR